MSIFIMDANVAIKWVLPEIHADAARRLRRNDYNLIVPDFFFLEIGNILWKRIRRGEIALEEAKNDLNAISNFPLTISQTFSLMPMALEIAVRIDQAVYDCVYLALAVNNQCQLVTADERLYNALSTDVLFSNICWIEDIP